MKQMLKSSQALLCILAHYILLSAVDSGSGTQPSTTEGSAQCKEIGDQPSQCVHVFHGNTRVIANNVSLSTTPLPLTTHLEGEASEAELNISCRAVVTAWECYYSYTPCQSARGTQLPLCSQQCSELIHSLNHCYSSYTSVLRAHNSTRVSAVLTELLEFVQEINCSNPESFSLSLLTVDQDQCTTLNLDVNGEGSDNTLPETLVLSLLVAAALCLAVLLLVIVFVVVVCLRRRRRRSKSRVACSQQPNSVTTLRRLDSPNPSTTIERFSSEEEVNVRSDVQVARMITDRKRRHYVSLYTGSFIPYQQLDIRNVIGEGAYGKVTEGVWKDPTTNIEKRVAIKTLRSFSSEQQLNSLFTESQAMRDLDHPNVMKFLGMCFDAPEGYPYIILPFMANGSLLSYLKKKSAGTLGSNTSGYPDGLELENLFQFCLDVVDGMTYLVQQKFVHRDLAARNCMVSENRKILIGDFGLAEDLYSQDQKQSSVRLPVKWMPPESLKDGISNERTDMWSYGVTCWEVFSLGRSPYPGIENHEILQHISTGGRLKKPTLCPDTLYDIVQGCWQHNPRDRPSFEEMALTLRNYWTNSQPQHST